MPCMGPEPPDPKKVKAAFDDVMALLKTKYGIQGPLIPKEYVGGFHERHKELREQRNAKLEDAIYYLFQLDSWEKF